MIFEKYKPLILGLWALFSFSVYSGNIYAKQTENTTVPQPVQNATVKGVVKDATGEPLIGVSVVVKGTTNGAVTDVNGNFSIACSANDILVFSYIGYDKIEVKAGNASFHTITMKEDSELLDEVIVIGYGTTTRKHVIGAVDQIRDDVIKDRPVANITQALQGATPSLSIQQRNMNPNNNNININIRGVSSMNNNDPLVVIDGMAANDINAMNLLNPNDIESVSVLKDAGTAAIYGSRSANGVILITTKQGRTDMKPVVTFTASVGNQNPDILLKPVSGYQNALLRNDSYVNAGKDPIYTPEQIHEFAKGDSEWGYKAIMKNALQQNYNINVQGGSKVTTYNVSFGYYDQESNFKGQDFGIKKYNFRSNLTSEIQRLKLKVLLAYDRNEGRSDRGDMQLADVMRVPTYNTYSLYPDEDGKYYNNEITTGGNYLARLRHGGLTTNDKDHFQGIVSGDLKIWQGLKLRGVVGYDIISEHRLIKRRYYPVYKYLNKDQIANAGQSKNYSIQDYNNKATMLNLQFCLDYNHTYNDVHQVTGLFGFTSESFRSEKNEIRRNFVDPDLYQDTDDTVYETSSYNTPNGFRERALHSWLGRLGYSYKDKYYAEVNARYDGSSRFAKDNRWGFFPSMSLGWRISEENFLSFWKDKVGDMKIRGSYGLLGSQTVDDYQYLTTYKVNSDQYGFNNSSVTGTGFTFGNSELSWEKTKTFNIGFDASFLKNALNVTFDVFQKNTSDILLTPLSPGTLGGAVPKANIGKVRNNGWELTVNYRFKHKDFSHLFGFNIGDSRNKVLEYGDESVKLTDGVERIIREGEAINSYYGFRTDGLFQTEEEIQNSPKFEGVKLQPGDVKYVDIDKNGVINDDDRVVLGNAFPRYVFGFNYNFSWKGLDFSMLWQGVGKRDMALRGEMIEAFHGSYSYVIYEHQLDYWTPDNRDARYPRLINVASSSYQHNYKHSSDRNLYNAAYLRLKDIQIGYTIPASYTKKIGMKKVRVFLNGQNLLTFTKNKFIDPESTEFGNSMDTSSANSGRNYPTLKYFGGGIEIQF